LLDTTVRGSTRGGYIAFDQPIAGSGPSGGAPVAPPSGLHKARIIAQCSREAYNQNMLTMSAGQTIACPMYVRFDADGTAYRIAMNASEVAGTDDVTITCASGSPCTAWNIAPSGASSRGVLDKQGKGTTWIRQGTFSFSFGFAAMKP
jgi:hypothetical protein